MVNFQQIAIVKIDGFAQREKANSLDPFSRIILTTKSQS